MDFTICPNCKMRVFPKADGTCPSCQAIIPPGKSPSKPLEPQKSRAAAAAQKPAPSPISRTTPANEMEKPDKPVAEYRQAVLLDSDKNAARDNLASAVPRPAAVATHRTLETKTCPKCGKGNTAGSLYCYSCGESLKDVKENPPKKEVKMNDTLKMILWAILAGFLYGAYKTLVSVLNK